MNQGHQAPAASLAVALLLLLLGGGPAPTAAASADAWRSQVVYFLLTDRFAPSPGVTPAPCKLLEWNNGSWAGITANLGTLQDMGMTAVWITPIPHQFEGKNWGRTGYHGYWAADWTRLEPHHGTPADLRQLLAAAHSRGMLMMLDVVANHVGPLARNLSAVRPFSSPQHYHGCAGCDQHCAIPQAAYAAAEAWPPRRPAADAVQTCRLIDLPDLNQSVPAVRQGLISWLTDTLAAYPFDGIRMDTVKHVENGFWTDFTSAAKGVFSLGEVLNGNTRAMPQYLRPGPDGRSPMDSVLNFPLYYKLTDVFGRQQDMRQLSSEMKLQRELLGTSKTPLLGNFVDNHDFTRFLSIQPDMALFKNALAWMLLAEGIPIVYYGSASGMSGRTEDDSNRACLWERPYDRGSELFRLIATLSKLRTSHKLWAVGERPETVTRNCYSYSVGPDVLVVTTNRGSRVADAAVQWCNITLPAGSAEQPLLRAGLSGLRDVLSTSDGQQRGILWDPASRRLSVATPGGNPRVLLVGHASKAGSSQASAAAAVDVAESGQPASGANSSLQWGKAPTVTSAAGGRPAAAATLSALFAVAAVLLL